MKSYNSFVLTEAGQKYGDELFKKIWTEEEQCIINDYIDNYFADEINKRSDEEFTSLIKPG